MRLDKVPVRELSIRLQEGASLWPGGSAPLVVIATADDDREYVTAGAGQGKVLWDSYRIEASNAKVNGSGVVKLEQDPRAYSARPPHLRITALTHPEVTTEMDLPVRYDLPFEARFVGHSGFSGWSGSDGSTGSSGSNGSTDAEHPSAGGDGGRGGDGGNGSNGGDGDDGPEVHAFMTLQPGTKLVQVRVEAQTAIRYFLVDPNGGSLLIRSDGGSGGSGGRGGSGGSGGSGGMGWPPGSTGLSGSAGSDGSSGSAGRNGPITVVVDASALPYISIIRFSEHPGPGRVFAWRPGSTAPAPEIREGTVPPLW